MEFQSRAKSFLDVINTELIDSGALLYTVGAYVGTSERPMTAEQFERFVRVLHARVVGLRNVGWAPRVTAAQRWAFEHGGFPGVAARGYRIMEYDAQRRFIPAHRRPAYYPILFVETQLEDQAAEVRRVRGYDITSERERAAAVDRSIRTGQPSATPPIPLITVRGLHGGVLAFMPVTVGHGGFTGVVFEVFDISVMIDNIVAERMPGSGFDLYLFDRSGRPDHRLIYWHRSAAPSSIPPSTFGLHTLHWQSTLSMIDQRWGAIVTPALPPTWIAESWHAAVTLAVGLTMTAMIAGYSWLSLRRTVVLESLTETLRETTEHLEKNVERIAFMAKHDALTGLANRNLLRERMDDALARFRIDAPFSVLYLDLDRFKTVNDTLGHDAGDRLLCAVAARITGCLRENDTVARIGGDEFVILLAAESAPERSALVASRILGEVANPYSIDERRVVIGVSIGIATAATPDTTAEQLLKRADFALYAAKSAGRGTYRFFDVPTAEPVEAQRPL